MREAGDRTTWTDPDEQYESAVHAAVDALDTDEDVDGCSTTWSNDWPPRPGATRSR